MIKFIFKILFAGTIGLLIAIPAWVIGFMGHQLYNHITEGIDISRAFDKWLTKP